MALVTVLKFTFTFAFAYAIFILMGPVVKTMGYDTGLWNGLPTSEIVFRDNLYGIWLLFIVFIAGITILIAYQEAQRRARTQG